MTLQCKYCGGSVEVQSANYPYDSDGNAVGTAFEQYECVDCGATGTYEFGDTEQKTGCVQ